MHTASLNLGYDFVEVSKNLVENYLLDVKERCKKFLCTMAIEMQKRLPEYVSILIMITVLKPEVATSQVKPRLNNILQRFYRSSVYGNKNYIEAEWNQPQNKLWINASGSSAEFLCWSMIAKRGITSALKIFQNLLWRYWRCLYPTHQLNVLSPPMQL